MNAARNKALAALLTQPTQKAAAQAAGISEDTIARYLKDPAFLAAYNKAFADVVRDATRQAQQMLNPALNALQEVVQDKEVAAGARIAAARSILEYGLRFTEFNDIEQIINAEDSSNVL